MSNYSLSQEQEFRGFLENSRFKDGLNRCNKVLKRSHKNPFVHLYKAKFLYKLGQHQEAEDVLASLVTVEGSNRSDFISEVDRFIWEWRRDDTYPSVLTNGPAANKLWNALLQATSKRDQPDVLRQRYSSALSDQRWIDAGYALTSWKKIETDRTELKFAHLAVYHFISQTSTDPMIKQMNGQLACRTATQLSSSAKRGPERHIITAVMLQHNRMDLLLDLPAEEINALHFERFRSNYAADVSQFLADTEHQTKYKETLFEYSKRALGVEVAIAEARGIGAPMLEVFENPGVRWKELKTWLNVADQLGKLEEASDYLTELPGVQYRHKQNMLGRMWVYSKRELWTDLAELIVTYYTHHAAETGCVSELCEFLLALPKQSQVDLRRRILAQSKEWMQSGTTTDSLPILASKERTALKIEYLFTIGQCDLASVDYIYRFVGNCARLETAIVGSGHSEVGAVTLPVRALVKAYETDGDIRHLLRAAGMLASCDVDGPYDYQALLCSVYIYLELGLPSIAMWYYDRLRIREIQLDVTSHIVATRLSIMLPISTRAYLSMHLKETEHAAGLLSNTLDMYEPTCGRIVEQQYETLEFKRPDLLLELEDLRTAMAHSFTWRLLVLEQRRMGRLGDVSPDNLNKLHPAVVGTWLNDLCDNRDYQVCEKLEGDSSGTTFEQRMHFRGRIPDAQWIKYHLWMDEICSIFSGQPLLNVPFLGPIPVDFADDLPSFTAEEKQLAQHWDKLRMASLLLYRPADFGHEVQDALELLLDTLGSLEKLINGIDIAQISSRVATAIILPCDTIQHVYLILDFLKAVGNFGRAAKGTTYFRTVNSDVLAQALKTTSAAAEAKFDELQDCIAEFAEARSRDKLLALWKEMWKGQQTGLEGIVVDAEQILRAEKTTLDCMRQIVFVG